MVNQLLQVMALLYIQLDILLFHIIADVVMQIAQGLSDWDVHFFDSSDRRFKLF
jgi:hypothetical protein